MSSPSCYVVGPGELLANLRRDLKNCTSQLLVIGPWIDDYFADQIVGSLTPRVSVGLLTRTEDQMDKEVWARVIEAATILREGGVPTEHRTLPRLHAKCILVDRAIVYCGSFNWYRYSLETSQEVAVRMPSETVDGVVHLLDRFWSDGTPRDPKVPVPSRKGHGEGLKDEILDPMAAEALKANPKAFVIGKRRDRK